MGFINVHHQLFRVNSWGCFWICGSAIANIYQSSNHRNSKSQLRLLRRLGFSSHRKMPFDALPISFLELRGSLCKNLFHIVSPTNYAANFGEDSLVAKLNHNREAVHQFRLGP